MKPSRKWFIVAFIAFMGALLYASYDISTRTTFPGSKPQLKERIQDKWLQTDTTRNDSTSKF